MIRHTLHLLLPALWLACGLPAIAGVEIDESEIYYGDPDFFEKPAVVAANDIFMAIPAYRKIVDEHIPKSDPRYWLLMEEANKIFRRALARTRREHGYDLVGEIGSIQIDGESPPEITEIVVGVVEDLVRGGGGGED